MSSSSRSPRRTCRSRRRARFGPRRSWPTAARSPGGWESTMPCWARCRRTCGSKGTPDDVPAALDLARIETQAQGMAPFLKSLADCKELSALRVIVPDYQFFPAYFGSDHRSHGPLVMSRAPGSALADHPLDGAMVQVLADRRQQFSPGPRRAYAFDDYILLRTNRNGAYPFGPVRPQPSDLTLQSFAASFDEHGQLLQSSTYYSGWETPYERLETFPAQSRLSRRLPARDGQRPGCDADRGARPGRAFGQPARHRTRLDHDARRHRGLVLRRESARDETFRPALRGGSERPTCPLHQRDRAFGGGPLAVGRGPHADAPVARRDAPRA